MLGNPNTSDGEISSIGYKYVFVGCYVDIGIITRVGDSVRMTASWHSMSPWHQSPVVSILTWLPSYHHCYLWCQLGGSDHPQSSLGATTNNKMRIRSWKQIVSSGREEWVLHWRHPSLDVLYSLSPFYLRGSKPEPSIDHCLCLWWSLPGFDVVAR